MTDHELQWAEWFDGGWHRLRYGRDFDSLPLSFRSLARKVSIRMGVEIVTAVIEDIVALRAYSWPHDRPGIPPVAPAYDWVALFDGEEHRLTSGKHFQGGIGPYWRIARYAAARRGVIVNATISGNVLVVCSQSVPRWSAPTSANVLLHYAGSVAGEGTEAVSKSASQRGASVQEVQ